jgi:hypothetical protein
MAPRDIEVDPRAIFLYLERECAEPHALAALLHKYHRLNHGLDQTFLAGVTFPKLAVDDATGKDIKPCPVCAQWVTDTAPMTIQNLEAVAMKNNLEIDEDDRRRVAEQEALAAEKEKEEQKEEERAAARAYRRGAKARDRRGTL